ncbi:MAG: tyrosine-type recombinase/integrase [Gammaproteobacteria bacterium]
MLNAVANSVAEEVRGAHPEFVFTHRGKPVLKMNNSAWKSARVRAGSKHVRVHDLKHTFGRRLRAANVSFTDRQDFLGHKSSRITDHYSSAKLENLLAAANSVGGQGSRETPALVLLRECAMSAQRCKYLLRWCFVCELQRRPRCDCPTEARMAEPTSLTVVALRHSLWHMLLIRVICHGNRATRPIV